MNIKPNSLISFAPLDIKPLFKNEVFIKNKIYFSVEPFIKAIQESCKGLIGIKFPQLCIDKIIKYSTSSFYINIHQDDNFWFYSSLMDDGNGLHFSYHMRGFSCYEISYGFGYYVDGCYKDFINKMLEIIRNDSPGNNYIIVKEHLKEIIPVEYLK